MKCSTTILVYFLFLFKLINAAFELPEVKIEAFKPKGVRISIPEDNQGVQTFAFHGNVNKFIRGKEEGDIQGVAHNQVNGRWTIDIDDHALKVGDKINYWVFIQHNRLGFDREDQSYEIKELVDRTESQCISSLTTINGGKVACKGALIFEDNFSGSNVDDTKWITQQYSPLHTGPDYEFVSYESLPESLFIRDNSLFIKPIEKSNPTDMHVLDLTDGCTSKNSQECRIDGDGFLSYLPVFKSAQLKSKTSFRYGKIEIRARLPIGDWIYPQLRLAPKDFAYGPSYESGEILVAFARGNPNLLLSGDDVGNNNLYAGPVIQKEDKTYLASKVNGQQWGSQFHDFSLIWRPDGFTFMVDGVEQSTIRNPTGGYSALGKDANLPYADHWETGNAPFDKEFIIKLGVGVGGQSDFPKNSISNGKKIWSLRDPRAILRFYGAKDKWKPTWKGDNIALRVDHVRVYAL